MSEKINVNDFLKVATINTLNNKELFIERMVAIVDEADTKNMEVLLLQEVLTEHRQTLIKLFKHYDYDYYYFGEPLLQSKHQTLFGNVIASRFPLNKSFSMMLTSTPNTTQAAVSSIQVRGQDVHIISAHLIWGGANGHIRIQQARLLNEYAIRMKDANPQSTVIIGGDFNEEPDSDVIRFMQGKRSTEGIPSAYWVDATFRTELENHPTSRPHGEWGIKTAEDVGIINPLQVPERKIDYLWVHGWVHGTYGMPHDTSLFGINHAEGGHEVSDHYGISSEFWLPAR